MSVFLEALENIGLFDWIGEAFSYLYELYFETAFPLCISAGEYAFNSIYNFFVPYINTGQWISAIIGIFLFIPFFKLIINIVRG